MFYGVHCNVITNENQQDAQTIYIYFFLSLSLSIVAPTCFGRA